METQTHREPWERGTTNARGATYDERARRAAIPAPRPRRGMQRRGGPGDGEGLATFLGWFSIGLGLAQVAAPEAMARLVGARDDSRSRSVMRGLGMRELASGIGILSAPREPGWLWSRVAGDMMDLALLGRVMQDGHGDRDRTAAATAAVVGVAALDVIAAQQLSRQSAERSEWRESRGGERSEPDRGVHTARSVTIARPAEEVYAFWHDFENLPRFMRHLEAVRSLGDGRSHWVARAPAGRTVEWDAEIVEDRPNELISWRSVEGADVRNAGTVRFRPAPGGRGTEVHVDLRYDPPGGVLGSKLAMLFREEPGQQVQDDLFRFKQVMETGEVVVSDATYRRGPHPARPPKGPARD